MNYLRISLHTPSSNDLLVIVVKPIAKDTFRVVAILLLFILRVQRKSP
jgi:hypothetical protein